MANETTFTLTFKTIAELTGLDRLLNGVQNGVKKLEGINNELKTIASSANTLLTGAGAFLAAHKLNEYSKMASDAREAQAAFAFTVLRSKDGSREFLEELIKLNKELAETTDTSEATSRSIEQQLLIFQVAKEFIPDLTRLTIDFAKARNMDPGQVGQMLSRAISGEDLALTRFGLHLDKTKTHAQQIRDLIKQLEVMVGGTAKVIADADGGVTQAEFGWRRLKIAIGDFVNLARIPFLVGLTGGLKGLKTDLDSTTGSASSLGRQIYVTAGQVGQWIGENLKLAGSIVVAGAALAAFKTSVALVGGPLTIIIAAIIAANAGFTALTNKVMGAPVTMVDAYAVALQNAVAVFKATGELIKNFAHGFVSSVIGIMDIGRIKALELFKTAATALNNLTPSWAPKIDTNAADVQIAAIRGRSREMADAVTKDWNTIVDTVEGTQSELEQNLFQKIEDARKRALKGEDTKKELEKLYAEYSDFIKNIKATPGPGITPGADGTAAKTAATDALTGAKYRLAAAEQNYKNALETTKLLEESGEITRDQANQRNLDATRAYIAELERAKAALPGLIAQLQAVGNTKGADEAKLQYQELTNKILEAQRVLSNSTFFGKIRAQIRELATEWGDVGKQVGGFLSQQFQNFASTAGNAIGALIFRTGNWRQSIVQLAQSFVSSLATMLIQWILARTVMAALNKAFGAADASAAGAQATGAAAAWAPAATAASIASYGVAAGLGLSAYLSALGIGTSASIAAAGAGGFFRTGGFTGHGPEDQAAGIVHFEEVVIPAPRVRELGRDWLVNLAVGNITQPGYQRGGIGGGRPGSGASPIGGNGEVTIINVNDWETAVQIAMKRRGGRTIIVDTISDRKFEV